jgi:hypothetical protein
VLLKNVTLPPTYIVVLLSALSANVMPGFTATKAEPEVVFPALSLTLTCTTSGDARSEEFPTNTELHEVPPKGAALPAPEVNLYQDHRHV